jgi:hypothetical protein
MILETISHFFMYMTLCIFWINIQIDLTRVPTDPRQNGATALARPFALRATSQSM